MSVAGYVGIYFYACTFTLQTLLIPLFVIFIKQQLNISNGKTKFLIDGFPRNADNWEGWVKDMSDFTVVNFVLALDCDQVIHS